MNKTKRVMVGVTTAAVSLGLAGCGDDSARPPMPDDDSCKNWEWSEVEGVWRCDETNSRYYRSYYFGGRYFKDKTLLAANSAYQTYKNTASTKKSTGFGSGSSSFGG